MRARIAPALIAGFAAHARACLPAEACALILGRPELGRPESGEEAGGVEVDEIAPVPNVAADPLTQFEVDPAAHLALQRRCRKDRIRILGVAHSHPFGPPAPSQADLARAIEPSFFWLIWSVPEKRAALWWHEGDGRFRPAALIGSEG